ncbi:HAD hydrolase-like protein [Caldalkalibacillus mannanilyticus]|uniref:HAD hydrolase-like protein n=1 Tax=Caldalkalibacillus mannanilyticus TaxID=1418 RepID=UPI000A6409CB|nr:HAD hydrolase-like protein [Caldalkalibacillus mannanilyticus]
MFKHVIFDFDGTIADSIDLSLVIYNELAQKYHYRTITIEELREMNNLPIKERLKK